MKMYADFKVAINVPEDMKMDERSDLFLEAFRELEIEFVSSPGKESLDMLLLPNKPRKIK